MLQGFTHAHTHASTGRVLKQEEAQRQEGKNNKIQAQAGKVVKPQLALYFNIM